MNPRISQSSPRMWIRYQGVIDDMLYTLSDPDTPASPEDREPVSDANAGREGLQLRTVAPLEQYDDGRGRGPWNNRIIINIKDQEVTRPYEFLPRINFLPPEQPFEFRDTVMGQGTPIRKGTQSAPSKYILVLEGQWSSTPPVETDLWSCTVLLRDMPVDPRIFRYLELEMIMTLNGSNPDDPDADVVPLGVGMVDEIGTDHGSEDQGVTVTISGRDLSSPLRDTVWTGLKGQTHIEIAGAKLSDTIDTLLDAVGAYVRLERLDTSRIPPGFDVDLGKLLGKKIYSPESGDSVWDVCTSLCSLVGMEFVLEGRQITIQPPQFFRPEPVAHYVYGGPRASCESMTLARTINSGIGLKNVTVRGRNTANREILIGRYRPAAAPAGGGAGGGGGDLTANGEVEYAIPPGAWTQELVDALAALIYGAQTITVLDGRIVSSAIYPSDTTDSGSFPSSAPSIRARDTLYVGTTVWDTVTGDQWIADKFGVRVDLGRLTSAYMYAVRSATHAWDYENGYTATIDIMMPLALRSLTR